MKQDNTRIIENIRENMRKDPSIQDNKDVAEILDQTIQLLERGFDFDKLIRLLELTKAGIEPDEVMQIMECKRNGMSEDETVEYIMNQRKGEKVC